VLAVVLTRALAGEHTSAGMASAFGTAFWASAALTAFAVVPAYILLRAERAALVRRPRQKAVDHEAALETAAA
jgi:hypothetical protein